MHATDSSSALSENGTAQGTRRRRAALIGATLLLWACATAFSAGLSAPIGAAHAQESGAEGDLLTRGRMALEEDRAGEALVYFEAVLADAPDNRQAVLGRAQALDELGRMPEAIAVYDSLLADNPSDPSALFYRAIARYHLGELDAAEADILAAIDAGLTLSVVYQRLGDARYARGDLLGALAAYQSALEAPSPDPSVYRAIGNAAYGLRDYAAAERAYGLALEKNPQDGYAAYYRGWTREKLGRTLDALQDYNRAFEIIGGREPRVAIDRGAMLLENGAAAAALEDFLTALALQPDNTAALYGAAVALLDQGQSAEAEPLLDRLIAIVGDNRTLGAAALFQRGRARLLGANFDGARADFDLAISLAPGDADAYYNRALARLRLDDVAGALEDLETAAELAPNDAEIHYGLARASVIAGLPDAALAAASRAEALAQGDPAASRARAATLLALDRPLDALRELDAHLDAAPRDAEAMRFAGAALIRLRRYDDALALAQRLGARAPRSPAGPLLEAEAHIGRGETEPARAALNRANRLGAPAPVVTRLASERWITVARTGGDGDAALFEPGDALAQAEVALDRSIELSGDFESIVDRAAVRIMRGDLDAAREDLDRAIQERPQDARLRFARADVLRRLGQCEAAIRDYDAGLSLDPRNSDARSARASCKLSEGRYLGAASDIIVSWF